MKSKTFVVLMVCAFVAALGVLMGSVKLAAHLWGIFHDPKIGVFNGINHITSRNEKAVYITQEDLPYTAFILGGSKASALQPEILNGYTGEHFYNFCVPNGNFRDYTVYADFFLSTYDVKEIVLHVSTHEAEAYIRKSADYIPAVMAQTVFSKIYRYAQYIKLYYLNAQTFFDLYRSRRQKKDAEISAPDCYGARSRSDDDLLKSTYEQNEVEFQKKVLSYWGNYDKCIHSLFYQIVNLPACDQNIAALSRIKAHCDEQGVKFTLVIGPTFIAELYKYASPQFIQYLKDIVSICPAWNFSGINDVNLNPYNFYNGGHHFIIVADKMIETMYSPEPNTTDLDAFGILLTPDNIDAYIESQRQKWLALKAEYDATGTIALHGKTDASYLGK